MRSGSRRSCGGALLMVLWLSAALSAIAFSVALSVRGELNRTDTAVEGLKAYYLACGAADRALNYMLYGSDRFWAPGVPLLRFAFPQGEAAVEIIPESAKLNVNRAPGEEIYRLLLALGLPPEPARQVMMAILDWRAPSAGGGPLEAMYLSQVPSFRAPHASLEQIEELMSVAGVTPELFYGGFNRGPQGELVPRAGLRDCLSVNGYGDLFDINTTEPAVMAAVGVPPEGIAAVVNTRRQMPIRAPQMGALSPLLGQAAGRFRIGGEVTFTLRATARLRRQDGALSDLRRTVAMTVLLNPQIDPDGYRVLAWRENDFSSPLFQVWPQ